MFDTEESTTFSTYPVIVREDRLSDSSPELFSSTLENKFEENGSPNLDSPILDVTEDFPDPAEADEEDGDGDDESVTSSAASDDEEEEEEVNTNELLVVDDRVAIASLSANVVEDVPVPSPSRSREGEASTMEQAVPAVDQPPQVSILGGRYLLIANPPTTSSSSPQPVSTAAKNVLKCIHVETREQFLCKVVPRSLAGLNLLAAYHQLNDFANCVNPINEIILSPKSFYLIFPTNYGNVHAYVLAKKRLPEDEAAHLFKQMVTAVKHCHSKGIVLRDLKLGKFVFTDKERTTVKLETLEDAVVLPRGGEDGLSDKHGCPNYVSPEKAEILKTNGKYPGRATDIWGLGVMLYTMLVGRYPFNDPDHGKLFVKIRKGLFTIPECFSQNVKCVIRCLLRKDPATRLSCDEILRHPWIVDQRHQWTTVPRSTYQITPTTTERLAVGTRRSYESTTDNNNDDQVVPVWTPPSKKPRVDDVTEVDSTHWY